MNNPIESAIPARIMNESGLLADSAMIAPKPDAMKQNRRVLDGVYMVSRINKSYSIKVFPRCLFGCGTNSHPHHLGQTNVFLLG